MKYIFVFFILFFIFLFQIFFLNNLPFLKYLNLALIFILLFFQKEEFFFGLGTAILGGLIMDFNSLFFRGFFSLNLILLFFILYFLAKRMDLKHLSGLLFFSLLGFILYQITSLSISYLFFFLNPKAPRPRVSSFYWSDFFCFLIVNLSFFLILCFIYGQFKFFSKGNRRRLLL